MNRKIGTVKNKFDIFVRRLRQSDTADVVGRLMDTLKDLNDARVNPSAYSYARAALAVTKSLSVGDLYLYDAIDKSKWKKCFPSCVLYQTLDYISPVTSYRTKLTKSGDTVLHVIEKPGVALCWAKDYSDDTYTDIYAHVDHYDTSVKWLQDTLWKYVNSNRIVLTSYDKISSTDNDSYGSSERKKGQIAIAEDNMLDSANSKFANDYATYLKKYLDKDIYRTVLFYGFPGTGKSTISRSLCDILGLRSLRVRIEDMQIMDSETLGSMIQIFKPDVLIFDDLDRAGNQISLLEMLESAHKSVKLVFATVNNINELDPALKRPGRFDEIHHVAKLDEVAVKKLLGEYVDAYEITKDWPVAFIKEYVIRRSVHGAEQARDSVIELQKRVDKLSEYYEEPSNSSVEKCDEVLPDNVNE